MPPSCSERSLKRGESSYHHCTVYVPRGAVSAYMQAEHWKEMNIKEME